VTLYDFEKHERVVLYRFYDFLNILNNNQFFKRNYFRAPKQLSHDYIYEIVWVNENTQYSLLNPIMVYDIDGQNFDEFQRKFVTYWNGINEHLPFKRILAVSIKHHDLTDIFKEVSASIKKGIRVYDFVRYALTRMNRPIVDLNPTTDVLEVIDDESLDVHTFKAKTQLVDIRF